MLRLTIKILLTKIASTLENIKIELLTKPHGINHKFRMFAEISRYKYDLSNFSYTHIVRTIVL